MGRTALLRRQTTAAVIGAGIVLGVTACGSTVQGISSGVVGGGLSAPGSAGTSGDQGLSVGAPGSTGQTGGLPGLQAGGGSGQPGAPGASGYPTGAAALSTPAPGTSGPGYTATQIYIGVAYDSTYSQELGQSGVSSGSTTVGDQKEQVDAIVNDINHRGGVAGRKVVPVFYDTNGLSSQNDPSTLAQAACAKWTQDKRVFAATTFVVQMDNPTLYTCLTQRHVIYVPLGGDSEQTLQKYAPYLWSPPGLAPERLAPAWIQRLSALGYFSPWDTTLGRAGAAPVKIGLLYGDGYRNGEPSLDTAFVNSVKSALARQGRRITDSAQISNSQADEASAVLRFKSDGVTHVIGDYSIVNFTTSAESQEYRPRYGFTSLGGGAALKLFASSDQLNVALGVGWVPSIDVDPSQNPGDVSPAETHCRAVMNQAHQPTGTQLAWFAMTQACETFDFLAAAIPRSGLVPEAFPNAAVSLGSMPPVSTFVISFPRGRPDGAGAVRDVAYNGSCGCFAYLSKQNYAA